MSWKTFISLRMMSRTGALDHASLDLGEPALELSDPRQAPLARRLGHRGGRGHAGGKEVGLRVAAHALEILVEGVAVDQIVIDLQSLGVVPLAVVEIRQCAARGRGRLLESRRRTGLGRLRSGR